MIRLHNYNESPKRAIEHSAHTDVPVYTREAFRAILASQPEWKIRAALEDGNIPQSNIEHALEWLEEQANRHRGFWS